jgi:hypothetical protein
VNVCDAYKEVFRFVIGKMLDNYFEAFEKIEIE